MQLGFFTTLLADWPLTDILALCKRLGFSSIELSSRAGRGLAHFNPVEIDTNPQAADRFRKTLADHGVGISALNCASNPVSPMPGVAEQCREDFALTFRLAEKLRVDTVCAFSGCPGGGPLEQTPNWITCPWPPEFSDMLAWQWQERLIPFWDWASRRAGEHGVEKLAVEMHPGFCVYNPETLIKLRSAVGNRIGANLDPSHLVWQGIDIPAAIRTLGGAIFHVHAKDTQCNLDAIRHNGVLDTKPYSDVNGRAWLFRTVGYGMPADTWKAILSALRIAGYDGAISIEHEDALLSKADGLAKAAAFLREILFSGDAPENIWWA